VRDLNGDGRQDVVLQFSIPSIKDTGAFSTYSTTGVLDADLTTGSKIRGIDRVQVIP
jgi:hypothetical protein